jgi:hypothetical protein
MREPAPPIVDENPELSSFLWFRFADDKSAAHRHRRQQTLKPSRSSVLERRTDLGLESVFVFAALHEYSLRTNGLLLVVHVCSLPLVSSATSIAAGLEFFEGRRI